MTDGDATSGDSTRAAAALAAFDRLADPVVAVETGRVTFANEAARAAFDCEMPEGDPVETVLGPRWAAIEPALEAAEDVRTVSLPDERFDARVHPSADGATVAFEPADRDPPSARLPLDRAVAEAPVGMTIADATRDDEPLVYANDAFEEITGYPAADILGQNCRFLQGPETDPDPVAALREAIAAADPVTAELRNYRRDGTAFWNEVTVAPVRDADGHLTHFVGFQNDVTARKRAEREAERKTREARAERARLERVLDRVRGLLGDVTAAVAAASSREEIERDVCDRIAAEDAFERVWIGERTAAETVAVRTTGSGKSGSEPAADDESPDGTDEPPAADADLAAAALEAGEAVVDRAGGDRDDDVTGDDADNADESEPVDRAAFPLLHGGVTYGVLAVETAPGERIDEREEAVLWALARAVAGGVDARETSRILATDAVTVVELALDDDAFVPNALSAATDAEVRYHRSLAADDGGTVGLFTASGASVEDLEDAVEGMVGVTIRAVVDREDEPLFELHQEGPSLVERLSERGAVAREITAADGRARLAFELPKSADVRSVVEAVQSAHPGTSVASIRREERADETGASVVGRLTEELTDRQLDALQRAYLAGYFEWPRPTDGTELAASMGVARPTFHEHLRAAQAKLCRAVFERELPEAT